MLRVIFGEKGAGKTKRIIDEANNLLKSAKGTIVYIDDDKSYTRDINYQIRFIDASEYGINKASADKFMGFVGGILAQDFDLEAIYIDGFLKIVREDIVGLGGLFQELESVSDKFNVNITVSINGKAETAPEYIKKYLV